MNQDIIDSEFNRISLNMKIAEKEKAMDSDKKRKDWKHLIPRDLSFWKPFCFLLLIFPLGLEWTGLPAVAFYMVPLLQKSNIPLDPYWASALLASYRAIVSILGSTIIGKYSKRPVYFTSWAIFLTGLLSLTSYSYLNQDGLLTDNYAFAKWIPMFAILIFYTGFSLGFASIPYMLQVLKNSNYNAFEKGLQ